MTTKQEAYQEFNRAADREAHADAIMRPPGYQSVMDQFPAIAKQKAEAHKRQGDRAIPVVKTGGHYGLDMTAAEQNARRAELAAMDFAELERMQEDLQRKKNNLLGMKWELEQIQNDMQAGVREEVDLSAVADVSDLGDIALAKLEQRIVPDMLNEIKKRLAAVDFELDAIARVFADALQAEKQEKIIKDAEKHISAIKAALRACQAHFEMARQIGTQALISGRTLRQLENELERLQKQGIN